MWVQSILHGAKALVPAKVSLIDEGSDDSQSDKQIGVFCISPRKGIVGRFSRVSGSLCLLIGCRKSCGINGIFRDHDLQPAKPHSAVSLLASQKP
jgi:hypothetical protein